MLHIRYFRSGLCFLAVLIVLTLAVACASGDDADSAGDTHDLALVWEAWDVVQANHAAGDDLDQSAVAGGAIWRIMELGQIEPYPFLTDIGRMRGRPPTGVPVEMLDVWRATQLHRVANPEAETGEMAAVLIRGMMDGLPEIQATYLTAEQLPEAKERLARRVESSYVGIGARVVPQEGTIFLVPFSNSPAEKAGIEPGDALVAVEGVPVGDDTPSQVGQRIRGEAGTKVRLTLARQGEEEPLELDVFRGDIQLPTVEWELIPGGIGFLRVYRFLDHTGQEVIEGLERLKRLETLALILDLRGNPGGATDAAAEVAGQFLTPGAVFRQVEGMDGVRSEHLLPEEGNRLSLEDMLVVTLVDGDTMGSGEAVAAALQEAGRATIIGEPTLGDGSEYSFVELSDGSALYLPVSRWYTPGGVYVGDDPVEPDILVDSEGVTPGSAGDRQIRAAYDYLDSQLPPFR